LVERTTIAGETEELGENLPQRHFVPPQIPHDQVRFQTPDQTRALVTLTCDNIKCLKKRNGSWYKHYETRVLSTCKYNIVTGSRKGGHCYLHGNEGNK
jgi:hypothetical protein